MPTNLQNTKTFNNYSIILSDSKYLQQTQVFTHLNPNLQTQANPSSKNPKLKIAFLFLTNSDLHFAPFWQQFFQNALSKNLYNVYVHVDPSVNVTCPKGTIFEFCFISVKKTYCGSLTLISVMRRLLTTAVINDPANAFFAVLSLYCVLYLLQIQFSSGSLLFLFLIRIFFSFSSSHFLLLHLQICFYGTQVSQT